ncbi:GntR family transcriptional regulator [Microbacterium tumbae]
MSTQGARPVQTTHEWVRDGIRRAIVDGTYPPGAPLKQTELAAAFGTSVTPVREAMRDLVAEGLVQFDPQRIARVRSIDVDEAVEIYEMRLLLEPLAVSRATAHATTADIERFRELAAVADAAVDDAAWLAANRALHLEIIETSRSPQLAGVLGNLRRISGFYLGAVIRTTPIVRAKSSEQHSALIDAIEAADGPRAAAIMRDHISVSHPQAPEGDVTTAYRERLQGAMASGDPGLGEVS